MDGVLIDSMPYWKSANKKVLDEVGGKFSEELWNEIAGQRLDEVVDLWYQHHPWDDTPKSEVIDHIESQVVTEIKERGTAKDGVHDILKFFKSQGVPRALASSSAQPVIDAVIDTLDIKEFFQLCYSATNEQYGKPHPGVYLTTAQKLEVEPGRCLVFEDSLNGLIAAKAAKMRCVIIPDRSVKDSDELALADCQLQSLSEFSDADWQRLSAS